MAGGSHPDTTPASATNPGFSSPLSLAIPGLDQFGANNPFAALLGQVLRGAAQLPLQQIPRQLPAGGTDDFNNFMMQVMNASQPATYVPQTMPQPNQPVQMPKAAPAPEKKKDERMMRGGSEFGGNSQGRGASSPAGGSGNGSNGWGGK